MKLKQISYDETKDFILNKHYAGRMPSISYAFGCFEGNELIGICTIGKPASHQLCIGICGKEYSSQVYELNRLCFIKEAFNASSRLVGYALRELEKHNLIIVSYADTGMSHVGYVYQATNFIYTGKTKQRTDKYTESGKHSRHYEGKESTTHRVVRTAKHRYVYFAMDKRSKKQALSRLNYKIEPYPKGKSEKYKLGTKQKQILIKI